MIRLLVSLASFAAVQGNDGITTKSDYVPLPRPVWPPQPPLAASVDNNFVSKHEFNPRGDYVPLPRPVRPPNSMDARKNDVSAQHDYVPLPHPVRPPKDATATVIDNEVSAQHDYVPLPHPVRPPGTMKGALGDYVPLPRPVRPPHDRRLRSSQTLQSRSDYVPLPRPVRPPNHEVSERSDYVPLPHPKRPSFSADALLSRDAHELFPDPKPKPAPVFPPRVMEAKPKPGPKPGPKPSPDESVHPGRPSDGHDGDSVPVNYDPNLFVAGSYDTLKAEMQLLSTPHSEEYMQAMYIAIMNVEGECSADFQTFCNFQAVESVEPSGTSFLFFMPTQISSVINGFLAAFNSPSLVQSSSDAKTAENVFFDDSYGYYYGYYGSSYDDGESYYGDDYNFDDDSNDDRSDDWGGFLKASSPMSIFDRGLKLVRNFMVGAKVSGTPLKQKKIMHHGEKDHAHHSHDDEFDESAHSSHGGSYHGDSQSSEIAYTDYETFLNDGNANIAGYVAPLGFGDSGDSCMYANYHQLTSSCQSAIADVYSLREQYVHEDEEEHSHRHLIFWFLALVALTLGVRWCLRTFGPLAKRREAVQSILDAIREDPELKARVEAASGKTVPDACPYSRKKCNMRCVLKTVGALFIVFMSVHLTCHIIGGLQYVDENGEDHGPGPLIFFLVLIALIMLMLGAVRVLMFGYRAVMKNRRNDPSAPPANPTRNRFSTAANGVYMWGRNLLFRNPDPAGYSQLSSMERGEECSSEMALMKNSHETVIQPVFFTGIPVSAHPVNPTGPVRAQTFSNVNML